MKKYISALFGILLASQIAGCGWKKEQIIYPINGKSYHYGLHNKTKIECMYSKPIGERYSIKDE